MTFWEKKYLFLGTIYFSVLLQSLTSHKMYRQCVFPFNNYDEVASAASFLDLRKICTSSDPKNETNFSPKYDFPHKAFTKYMIFSKNITEPVQTSEPDSSVVHKKVIPNCNRFRLPYLFVVIAEYSDGTRSRIRMIIACPTLATQFGA